MKNKWFNRLLAFLISLPIVFIVIFFGYVPLHFDAVVYVNNIVGEGTCSTYISNYNKSFAYLYAADAYFGSELKTLKLRDLQYNVDEVTLFMYDIDEADIISFDISVFGHTVSHLNKDGVTHPYVATTNEAINSNEEPLTHLVMEEGEDHIGMAFPGNTLIPTWIWIVYFCFIGLVTLVLAALFSFLFKKIASLRLPLLAASTVAITMILGCFLCDTLAYTDYTCFLVNWLLLFAAAVFINSISLPWMGTAVVSLFTIIWYIANSFVIKYRNKPIMPADIKAFGTAREVAGSYDLTLTGPIIICLFVALFYLALNILLWNEVKANANPSLKSIIVKRGIGVAIAVMMIVFGINTPAFRNENSLQWDARIMEGFSREGIVLTFAKSLITAHVSKPEGYSREAVNAYLTEYKSQENKEGVRPTRIIMVMNEAFSDLRTVGLDDNIDVMPYVDSLDDNIIKGNLYVSIIGGGTCNTEFEGLTGNTLAFFGPSAYPYTENVTKPLFSLASYFEDSGYMSEAFHANEAHNWNRDMVYPNLGFEVFHSIQDYPELMDDNYLRNYVTDETDYNFIKQRDQCNEGSPDFLFNVTIQNHGSYEHFFDVKEAESLLPYNDVLGKDARIYLSLIKISDDSIKQLIETYRDSDDPTMIIFFGDHQPMLSSETQGQIYTQMQHYIDFFKTKFFIWTNYEAPDENDVSISANFIPWLILKRGNFSMPPYIQMLEEVHEKYPVISAQGVIDSEGHIYDNVAELMDDPLIKKYQYVQYANIFDEIDPAWFEVKSEESGVDEK